MKTKLIVAGFAAFMTFANTQAQVGVGTTSPNSTLDVRGSLSTAYRAFTGATTAAATDNNLVFTGNVATTLTLPTAVGVAGRTYHIKNASATGPTPILTIATTSSQTIDGITTWTLSEVNTAVTVVSNGTNWQITSNVGASSAVSWSMVGNANILASNFLGTTDDKAMVFKSFNQPYLEFGRRQTLGLTQGYPDYTDNNEKVTYVRSALQFEAPGADFYKPKMFTDVNGNFRVKGSAAGTDLFEFGSTGTANNGGFEFIIGDDGDEPILFKSFHYANGMSEIMRLQSGRMAVGSNAFNATNPEKLLIDAGVTSSYNLMTGKGSIDNYLQINVQNRSTGTSASSDLVATADNGTETNNYVDLGINGSGYTGGAFGGANDSYLFNMGQNFLIGTGTALKSLVFMTGGSSQATYERMRIDGSGNVGIGNNAPAQKLDITGNMKLSGAFMPGNSAGTSGYFLTSNGAGNAPSWIDAAPYLNTVAWIQDGNAVTTLEKFGTTSNFALPFITNNVERMRISATGGVSIGTASFNGTNPEKFVVDAGITSSVNAIVGKGSINSYLQLNIQNQSNGANASSDVVATADNGSETTNFIDMGINSSTNNAGVMGDANDAYLYNIGQDLLIGTGSASKALVFMTGGTTQATNERMRIDGSGNIGVATIAPAAKLDVNGTFKLGSTGTVLTNMIKGSFNINDGTAFDFENGRNITVAVTGATVNSTVIVNPRTVLPVGMSIAWARVISAGNVQIGFTNTTSTPRSVGNITFDVTIIQ
ncbi:MAG: hypothetical protein H7Y27_15905 [Gemmatimonadaceae bacterium]|nr:hypothetical protein [Chitinophagaceae bacterium]